MCVRQRGAEPTSIICDIRRRSSLGLRSHLVTYRARPDQVLRKKVAGSDVVYL